MYERVNIDGTEPREVDGVDPRLRAVGYELRPAETRPSVWEYDAGETNNRHRQDRQEELYLVLDGRFEMTVDDGEGEAETLDLREGDVVVVPPASWRQLTAVEDGRVFVVGAPNVKDDGILPGEG